MNRRLIYLDNAATTFPKPREVLATMVDSYARMGVSPGRGGYDLAVQAEQVVSDTREKLAALFNAPDPNRIVFAHNATDAINLALQGMLRPGDHVVSTRLEHNSVLRPLNHLRKNRRIEFELVPFNARGFIDPETVAGAMRANTRAVVICHASNVLGTVQPLKIIGRLCRERGVALIVDAAQSAGVVPIDMAGWHLSAVAFTGHKSLMAPSGIGGLVLHPEADIRPTRFGGTGINSQSLQQTPNLPHRLEAGTLNLMGIMGLSAALDYLSTRDPMILYRHEMALLARLRDGLARLDGVRLYGATREYAEHLDMAFQLTPLLTVTVAGIEPADVGAILDADFGIAVRTGLHCAPLVHEDLGTSPRGGVRFSLGPFNTEEDIDGAIAAMTEIAGCQ